MSTIVPFARRRPQTAAPAFRLGGCRSAYPPGYVSWRTRRMARRKRDVSFVAVMMPRRYLARIFVKERKAGDMRKGGLYAAPAIGSVHPKGQNFCNELRFQPAPQIFVYAQMRIAVLVVKLAHRQSGNVALKVR